MASHGYVVFGGWAPGGLEIPPRNGLIDVSGTPHTIDKALQVVGKTLENLSPHGGRGLDISAL